MQDLDYDLQEIKTDPERLKKIKRRLVDYIHKYIDLEKLLYICHMLKIKTD